MGEEYVGEKGQYMKLRGHNFRKFFKTELQNAGTPSWVVEHCMGHALKGTDKAYFQIHSHRLREFFRAHQHAININRDIEQVFDAKDTAMMKELQSEMTLMREKESEKDLAISELMKISLELKDRLDEEKEMADEEENRQEIMSQGGTGNKSVDETKEMWKNFEESNDPEFIKAKKEGEKSRKISPKKLTMPTMPKQEG